MATIDASGASLHAAALLRTLCAARTAVIDGEIGVDLARRRPGLVRVLIPREPAAFTLSTEARAWAAAVLTDARAAHVSAGLSEYGPSTPDAPALAGRAPTPAPGTGHA